MRLTDEQRRKLGQKLQAFKEPKCLVCGGSDFQVIDHVYELREFAGGNINIGPDNKIVPLIASVCLKCGYMIFFNALVLGLIEPNVSKPENDDKKVN